MNHAYIYAFHPHEINQAYMFRNLSSRSINQTHKSPPPITRNESGVMFPNDSNNSRDPYKF